MSEKNNIENLFKNKFKDFEVAPPEQVWNNIETKLSENKKQKPKIPFWLRVSGAAAIFLIGVTIASNYFNKNDTQNTVVNAKGNKTEEINGKQTNSIEKPEAKNSIVEEKSGSIQEIGSKKDNSNLTSNENGVVNQDLKSEEIKVNSNSIKSNKNNSISEKSNQNSVVIQNKNSEKNNSISEESNQNSVVIQNKNSGKNNPISENLNQKSIANQDSKSEENNAFFGKNLVVSKNSNRRNVSISNKKTISVSNQNSFATNSSKTKKQNLVSKKTKTRLLNSSVNENAFALNKDDKISSKSEKISENENFVNSEKTKNISESNTINNQSNIISKNNNSDSKIVVSEIQNDTAKIVSNLPNPLEELLTKKDKKSSDKVAKVNRWQVFPNVAPIYFGSASNGSPIDDIFTKNSKNYKPNLSYGLAVNYSVNKRFSVQTGVNKVTLDYNTNDIVFYADLKATNIKTINTKNEAAKMTVENKKANTEESISTVVNQGYLNQKIGYIEIPVEVNYKLIDKKFGINLNAGISTLVLNENTVSVVSDTNFKMVLGEANNLNKFHLSSNIGVGFNYKFMKSFQVNVEPKLKYQINTFNSNDGNFKPYFIGIYSGISYHF
jgi:hypothetical protein